MDALEIGGVMEATYTTERIEIRGRRGAQARLAIAAALRTVGAVLAEGIRAEEFNRRFATPPSAQFAALPRSQQSKELDVGRWQASA
jgi:hypothetical protein